MTPAEIQDVIDKRTRESRTRFLFTPGDHLMQDIAGLASDVETALWLLAQIRIAGEKSCAKGYLEDYLKSAKARLDDIIRQVED
jgi:hypothetical protein